jgi:hypothetical protein
VLSLPWTLREIDSAGTAVTLTVPNGPCHDIKGVRTEIGGTSVTLTVLGTTCAGCDSTIDSIVAVRLPEPLASRQPQPQPRAAPTPHVRPARLTSLSCTL